MRTVIPILCRSVNNSTEIFSKCKKKHYFIQYLFLKYILKRKKYLLNIYCARHHCWVLRILKWGEKRQKFSPSEVDVIVEAHSNSGLFDFDHIFQIVDHLGCVKSTDSKCSPSLEYAHAFSSPHLAPPQV